MRFLTTTLSTLALSATAVSADTLEVPEQYASIQAAIDDAGTGDRISVAPGTYNEALDMGGKAIQLYGRKGASVTTIDASGLDASCIVCWNGEGPDTVIAGLTLTGGTGTQNPDYDALHGGGFFAWNASPTIVNCTITGNTAEFGGGMLVQESDSFIHNIDFENNSTTNEQGGGGGLYCFLDCNTTITECRFVNNSSNSGGGLKVKLDSNALVRGCRFTNNSSGAVAGAFAIISSSPTVERCLFENNTAATYGGGISSSTGTPALQDCEFRNNTAGSLGGGMRIAAGGAVLDGCGFTQNTAAIGGGGVVASVGDDYSLLISDSSFQENDGASSGGAVYMLGGTTVDIDSSNFCGNTNTIFSGNWNDNGGNTLQASCDATCPGDVNASGTVDIGDLLALMLQYGPCNGIDSCFADQTGDGVVDVFDLLLVIDNFGACP